MRAAIRILPLWLGMLTCLSISTPVSAQKKGDEYQNLIQQGLREYGLGNFSEAKSFFAQAHALSPNARTLRGLGMTSYELRSYVEAANYFEQALASNERPLPASMRQEVTNLLQQARSFVTHLRIKVVPESAELRLDTRPVTRGPDGDVLIDPGNHELVADAPDYESVTKTIRTDGNEQLSISFNLKSTKPEPQAQASAAKPEAPTSTAPLEAPAASTAALPDTEQPSTLGPWLLIGSSVAVAAGGGILLGLALQDRSKVEHPSMTTGIGPSWTPELNSALNGVGPLSTVGIIGLSAGGAGLLAGIIWLAASSGSGERPASTSSASAQLEPLPGGLQVKGRW
jgi:hypothetical protein